MKKIALLIGALFIPLSVYAQANNLTGIVQQAVISNPEVLARWHAFDASRSERDAARGGFFPRADLYVGAGNETLNDSLQNKNFNRGSASLTLIQMLYDGFATRSEVRRLDHVSMARLYEVYDASESVALEVFRSYFDVVRYRKLVNLAEDNYVQHRSVFEQIKLKAKAGVGRRVDLEQASGRLALAEANLLTETSNLHDVSARFQRLVGVIPPKDMEEFVKLTQDIPAEIVAAMKAAIQKNPALLAATENVRSADASVKARQSAYHPKVDFRLRSERDKNLNGVIGSRQDNVAEVVVSWNLFNGGSDSSRVRQYADQLNVARDLRDKACRDLRQTLAIAYNDTRKLTEQMDYLDQHQLSIEKARVAYRKQFDIGQRTLLDVLDTENELFQAKRAFVNAEADLTIAFARTHAGMGGLFGALKLSRPETGQLPNLENQNEGDEAARNCPPEAPALYVANKEALNQRASEVLKDSEAASGVPDAAQAAAAVAKPADPAQEAAKNEVFQALNAWINAWSGKNIAAYVEAYAATFQPETGVSYKKWLDERKKVIGAAKNIKLDITNIKLVLLDQKRATTGFRQTYQSGSFGDVVHKTLEWENIGGRWLIVREISAAP